MKIQLIFTILLFLHCWCSFSEGKSTIGFDENEDTVPDVLNERIGKFGILDNDQIIELDNKNKTFDSMVEKSNEYYKQKMRPISRKIPLDIDIEKELKQMEYHNAEELSKYKPIQIWKPEQTEVDKVDVEAIMKKSKELDDETLALLSEKLLAKKKEDERRETIGMYFVLGVVVFIIICGMMYVIAMSIINYPIKKKNEGNNIQGSNSTENLFT